jgi:hypothetical protein
MSHSKAKAKLDRLIGERGKAVHRGPRLHPSSFPVRIVSAGEVRDAVAFIHRLMVATDSALDIAYSVEAWP